MSWLRNKTHLIWLGMAILVVVAECASFYPTWSRFKESKAWFDHTHLVIETTREFALRIREAESAQRGFLLTGNPEHLRYYRGGVERAPELLRELGRLTADNPSQSQRVEALRPALQARLAELQAAVKLGQEHDFAAASALVQADLGRQDMWSIRNLLDQIEKEENQLLQQRAAATRSAARLSSAIFGAGSTVLLLLIGGAALFIHRDILRRSRLMEIAERQARIIQSAHEAIVVRDLQRRISSWNAGAAELYGWSEAEVAGKDVHRLLHSRLPVQIEDLYAELQSKGRWDGEIIQHNRDGAELVVESRQLLVKGADGSPMGILELNRDITSRKKAEEASRLSRERLEMVVGSVDLGLFYCDVPLGTLTWNERCKEHFGAQPDEEVTLDLFYRRIHQEDREAVRIARQNSLETGAPYDVVYRTVTPQGRMRWIRAIGRVFRDEAGHLARFDGVTLDVTAQHQSEQEMRQSRERLQAALDASEMGTFRWYLNTGELEFDEALNRMFGMPAGSAVADLAGFSALIFPDDRPGVAAVIARALEGADVETEYRIVWPDQSLHWISVKGKIFRDDSGKPVYMTGACLDATGRKRQEENLRQTQKLESVGLLAGGIAHDFNNLLVGILGNASLVAESPSVNLEERKILEEVLHAGERAADLTRQLLAYAGKGRFYMERVRLADLISETSRLVQTIVPKKIQLRLDLADTPAIEADRTQIQQVMMNLVINAAEAIGEERTGMVRVTTALRVIDQTYARQFAPENLPPGEYVEVEVQDNGCGMDAATLEKIFDPFFTTKFQGRGLGLAAVQGIVRGHQGALRVYSTVGSGTVFKVLFPANGEHARMARTSETTRQDLHGKGVVLVVDDELAVRRAAKSTLEHYGYTVLLAEDGRQAVELFEQNAGRVAVVLLDLTMPVLNGEETLASLQRIQPDVRVVLSSGFNKVSAIRQFTDKGLAGFVQKPYTAAQLAAAIKAARDGRTSSAGA